MDPYQLVCGCISLFLNFLLILLVIKKSPKSLGFYKYLMIYTSVFEIFYSIWDMIVEPTIDNYGASLYVYRRHTDSIFSRKTGFHLIAIYCGCFFFSMAVFGVHFIYRFAAFEKDFHEKYLSGKKIFILFFVPFVYLFSGASSIMALYSFTDKTDAYLREAFFDKYGTKVEDHSYMIGLYHYDDENGVSRINWSAFGVIGNFWVMIISSIYCVFYFGYKCYTKISSMLNSSENVSSSTKTLQKQLFQALVLQTLIPLILMYIPITILYIFPMMKINLGFKTVFVGYTIATFPAIDPLPSLIVIKPYRNAILAFFGIVRSNRKSSSDTRKVTPVSIVQATGRRSLQSDWNGNETTS